MSEHDPELVERVAWTICDDEERVTWDLSWLSDASRVLDLLRAEGRLCEPGEVWREVNDALASLQPTIDALMADNARLRAEVARLRRQRPAHEHQVGWEE